jgi:prophage tail gpP-like protein
MPSNDDLSLIVGGQQFSGWEAVRVTRGVERCPSDFDFLVTERNPSNPGTISIEPGQSCQVTIGKDKVLTGYVDRYAASLSPGQHQVRIQGRSKCSDIVDCSAGILPDGSSRGMVVTTSSLLDLATQLCAPFGVTVSSLNGIDVPVTGAGGAPVQFSVILTETPYEVIERVARYVGVLAYDGPDGNLILARVGSTNAASGFSQGKNVQAASVAFSQDERYSIYIPRLFSVDDLKNGVGGQVAFKPATDPGIKRFRSLVVVSEQYNYQGFLVEQRAQWEANRRYGRSFAVQITCDSWRDSAGTLWTPNTFATVDIPVLKLVARKWIIATVTYIRDAARGTVADLVLMPQEAFSIEPSALQPFDPQVAQALLANGGAAQTPGNVDAPGFRQ